MNKLEDFKNFVKQNPNLINYVKKNEMTWQKFYEIYDLYGCDDKIWDNYLKKNVEAVSTFDLLNWLKNIDVDSLQESINSVKRVIGVIQDLSDNKKETEEYKPRPIYKHFED